MSYEFKYVINKLKGGNVRFDISQNSEASTALILPDYNRILGLWPDINKPSLLWINEKFLENPNDKSVVWTNPGGHRIWGAPEKEFFIFWFTNIKNTIDIHNLNTSSIYKYSFIVQYFMSTSSYKNTCF